MHSLIIRMKLWRRIFTRRELIMFQKIVLKSSPQVKLDLKLSTMMNRKKNSEFRSSVVVFIVSNKTKFQLKLFTCKFKIELKVILSLLTTPEIACRF